MGWEPLTVINVEGVDARDAPGFSQWVNFERAEQWLTRAKTLTSAAQQATAAAAGFVAQLVLVRAVWTALGNFFRALNLRWYTDPKSWEIYVRWHGSFLPVDPDPSCTTPAILAGGPNVVLGSGLWCVGGSDSGPYVAPVCAPRGETAVRLLAAWRALKPNGPELRQGNWRSHIVPAFLGYDSKARVIDTSNPDSPNPHTRFEGFYNGMGCAGPGGWRERTQDSGPWTWECLRWNDAPLQDVRFLPPLLWSLEEAREITDALAARGPRNVVFDARIRTMLINVERAKQWGETPDSLSQTMVDAVKATRAARFDSAKDRATFAALAAPVCAGATVAGGIGGVLCAGAVAVVDLFLGVIPRAVGCDLDEFGFPEPSPLIAQLSLEQPPAFSVDAPAPMAGERRTLFLFPVLPPVAIPKAAMVEGKEKPGDTPPSKLPPKKKSSAAPLIVGAALILLGGK